MQDTLGYYGIRQAHNGQYENQLISDMAEAWGDNLQGLDDHSKCLLISALALKLSEKFSPQLDHDFNEAVERLDELSASECIGIIQTLAN